MLINICFSHSFSFFTEYYLKGKKRKKKICKEYYYFLLFYAFAFSKLNLMRAYGILGVKLIFWFTIFLSCRIFLLTISLSFFESPVAWNPRVVFSRLIDHELICTPRTLFLALWYIFAVFGLSLFLSRDLFELSG